MSAGADNLLTFSVVDGLAHACARGGLSKDDVSGKWSANELGPVIELECLCAQQLIPNWFMENHVSFGSFSKLISAARSGEDFTPAHGSNAPGLFHATSLDNGNLF